MKYVSSSRRPDVLAHLQTVIALQRDTYPKRVGVVSLSLIFNNPPVDKRQQQQKNMALESRAPGQKKREPSHLFFSLDREGGLLEPSENKIK